MTTETPEPVRVGLIGCGFISERYLQNAPDFPAFSVVACADLDRERARERAKAHGIPRVLGVDELLADPEVEVVLNLTTPNAHFSVGAAALAAGKGVYTEKTLAILLEDGASLAAAAELHGLRLGGAPDTFLGGGWQTARELIDAGAIGEPVAATGFLLNHGPERWHPHPDFYYQRGGGPLFDMAPYYLTALISLLGPVQRVTGSARMSFPERTILSQPRAGEQIPVEVATHLAAVLDFAAGPIATLVTSFDVWAHETPLLEVYGSEGTLSLPDPNKFGGPLRIRRMGDEDWREVPITRPWTDNARGLGLADMAACLRAGVPHRASGELTYHVLEIMHAVETASRTGAHVTIESSVPRPTPLPA